MLILIETHTSMTSNRLGVPSSYGASSARRRTSWPYLRLSRLRSSCDTDRQMPVRNCTCRPDLRPCKSDSMALPTPADPPYQAKSCCEEQKRSWNRCRRHLKRSYIARIPVLTGVVHRKVESRSYRVKIAQDP